jgi:hypothetical protein
MLHTRRSPVGGSALAMFGAIRASSRDGRVQFLGFSQRMQRPEGLPGDRMVSLGESAWGAPPPILAWHPIGTSSGHRFIDRLPHVDCSVTTGTTCIWFVVRAASGAETSSSSRALFPPRNWNDSSRTGVYSDTQQHPHRAVGLPIEQREDALDALSSARFQGDLCSRRVGEVV